MYKIKGISEDTPAVILPTGDALIIARITEWRGETRLDIRQFWQPPGNNGYVPTKKGVTIALENFDEFVSGLVALIEPLVEALIPEGGLDGLGEYAL